MYVTRISRYIYIVLERYSNTFLKMSRNSRLSITIGINVKHKECVLGEHKSTM
jgi:hypothetical protein